MILFAVYPTENSMRVHLHHSVITINLFAVTHYVLDNHHNRHKYSRSVFSGTYNIQD